jgi:hypothetical protein
MSAPKNVAEPAANPVALPDWMSAMTASWASAARAMKAAPWLAVA